MHVSKIEAEVIQAWREAAADLGFRFSAPYEVTTGAGECLKALGLVHRFGRRIGTLIQVGGEPSAEFEYRADDDYTWSCLGRTGYDQYNRDKWIEMLNDWKFFGPENETPSWYSEDLA